MLAVINPFEECTKHFLKEILLACCIINPKYLLRHNLFKYFIDYASQYMTLRAHLDVI